MAQSSSSQQSREVAKRVFAREFNNGKYTFKEDEGEYSPTYQLLPTGDKANRVFFVGTVTEIDRTGDDGNTLQARIVDPTGTFVIYAGQFAPDPQSTLIGLEDEVPTYVAVTGKPRTYEGDETGEVYATVRPEVITEVDEETRNSWIAETAEKTLKRINSYDEKSNEYTVMADENYDQDLGRYTDMVIDALTDKDSGLGADDDSRNDAPDPSVEAPDESDIESESSSPDPSSEDMDEDVAGEDGESDDENNEASGDASDTSEDST